MVKRFIVLAAVVLIIGMSLLAIQRGGDSSKTSLKGMTPGSTEQFKMPDKRALKEV